MNDKTQNTGSLRRPELQGIDPDETGTDAWLPSDIAEAVDGELEVVAVLGRRRMTAGELLALTRDQAVALDRAVDAPVDLMVNGEVVAQGELAVVGDHFAIRILNLRDRASA